jgi:hypothetical protein
MLHIQVAAEQLYSRVRTLFLGAGRGRAPAAHQAERMISRNTKGAKMWRT